MEWYDHETLELLQDAHMVFDTTINDTAVSKVISDIATNYSLIHAALFSFSITPVHSKSNH